MYTYVTAWRWLSMSESTNARQGIKILGTFEEAIFYLSSESTNARQGIKTPFLKFD